MRAKNKCNTFVTKKGNIGMSIKAVKVDMKEVTLMKL